MYICTATTADRFGFAVHDRLERVKYNKSSREEFGEWKASGSIMKVSRLIHNRGVYYISVIAVVDGVTSTLRGRLPTILCRRAGSISRSRLATPPVSCNK